MPLSTYNVYREQLTSLFQGHALWEPEPTSLYTQVSIGDVGFVREGHFIRMFNVLLEWNDPSNYTLCEPEPYTSLDLGPFVNIRESKFSKGDYCSRHVTNIVAAGPDDFSGITYSCWRKQGALLALPQNGLHKDIIRTKASEDYIRDHVDSWFSFAERRKLGVERMEDLILVTGCTFVTSWGVAAFVDSSQYAEVLRRPRGTLCDWREVRPSIPSVAYQNSHPDNPHQNQCIFIRGFRAKRVFSWARFTGLAEPLPDDSDNRRRPEVRITRRDPDVPSYRDPLIGVLDYLAEGCPDNTVAIVHDDDLQLVELEDTFTADAVASFLRQNEIGMLVENGVAILFDDEEGDQGVPEEKKAIFYAEVELAGELVPLILHPALSKYLLAIDITNQPVEYDYDLTNEEMTSPASYPPVYSLNLENCQGYPRLITVQASNDSPGTGVTVQDVLNTIREEMRTPARRREWIKFGPEERTQINAVFRKRCRTAGELGQGPCRIDYLGGRDRLQILPKDPAIGEILPAISEELWPFKDTDMVKDIDKVKDMKNAGVMYSRSVGSYGNYIALVMHCLG